MEQHPQKSIVSQSDNAISSFWRLFSRKNGILYHMSTLVTRVCPTKLLTYKSWPCGDRSAGPLEGNYPKQPLQLWTDIAPKNTLEAATCPRLGHFVTSIHPNMRNKFREVDRPASTKEQTRCVGGGVAVLDDPYHSKSLQVRNRSHAESQLPNEAGITTVTSEVPNHIILL